MSNQPQLKTIDEVPEEVANKLIKMLALAYSDSEDNQGEVENAMSKAVAYAAKHDIDLATIRAEDALTHNPGASAEPFITSKFKVAKGDCRRPPSYKYIEQILLQHFKVAILRGGSKWNASTINIVGRKSDVAVATYVFGFLREAFTRLWREYKQRNNAWMNERASFFYGLFVGLNTKLHAAAEAAKQEALLSIGDGVKREKVQQTYAMIKVDEKQLLQRAMKDHHPVTTSVKANLDTGVEYGHAYTSGTEKGEKIEIRPALPEESTSRKRKVAGHI